MKFTTNELLVLLVFVENKLGMASPLAVFLLDVIGDRVLQEYYDSLPVLVIPARAEMEMV